MFKSKNLGNKYAQYNPQRVSLSIVAIKSLFLGILISFNLTLVLLSLAKLINISSIWLRLNGYIIFISIFHLLEFLCTALFNNREVDDDSFILNDWDLHFSHLFSIIEYVFKSYITQFSWVSVGLPILVMGQFIRSLAMYTASESFNHYIQKDHQESHRLVTNGVYSILRHPSYFGFFWWFIGLQLYLGNCITLIIGIWKLWTFFKRRIEYEEDLLVKFFGKEYVNYKSVTKTGIPFIH